jgi:hypothetical protein
MLILFFDTYITSGSGDLGGFYKDTLLADKLSAVRNSNHHYRVQDKIDVVKYTLDSYKYVKWDLIYIRFQCEDQGKSFEFQEYCRKLFPDALIENKRSATASQYLEALNNISAPNNSWVFFSPNNDHPLLSKPGSIERYVSLADEIQKKFAEKEVAILYSHFTESMIDNRITDPNWGYFGLKFKKVIYEDENLIVNFANKTPLDSIQLFKLGYLKEIFTNTRNSGRVIRLEDTEFCSSKNSNLIQICPKEELCRHYDGYPHLTDKVPPLFIPDGFFENAIKIRYGYQDRKKGWVNINPLAKSISSSVDTNCLLDDIPSFWADKISEIDINPDFIVEISKNKLAYYKNLKNPFFHRTIFFNIIRSSYIYIILQSWSFIRQSFKALLIKLGLFSYVRKIKRKILPDYI